MTAELDAAYFLLYGIERDDVQYILGTFSTGKHEPADEGLFPAENLVLDAYDRLKGAC